MKIPVFYTGEDKLLEFQIVDSTAAPINLGTYTNIVVWFYSKTDKTILHKFSMAALADHDTANFNVTNAANGQFTCLLEAAVTVNAVPDFYLVEIKVKELADSFKTIFMDYICEYREAETENVLN